MRLVFIRAVFPRPPSTLVLRLAHERLAARLELVEVAPPPPDGDGLVPRYACGRCGRVLLAGAPLAQVIPRGRRPAGVRCPGCAAVNLAQVNGLRPPPPA